MNDESLSTLYNAAIDRDKTSSKQKQICELLLEEMDDFTSKQRQRVMALLNDSTTLQDGELDQRETQQIAGELDPGDDRASYPALGTPKYTITTEINEDPETAAVGKYADFEWHLNKLRTELLNFENDIRPLGSSVGLISSSNQLRLNLEKICGLARANASALFPTKISRPSGDFIMTHCSWYDRLKRMNQHPDPERSLAAMTESIKQRDSYNLEDFPHHLELLAKDLASFLRFLQEIPEFTDEGMIDKIFNSQATFVYFASCLAKYRGKFNAVAVQRYVMKLLHEMGSHLQTIEDSLRVFRQNGLNLLKLAQTQAQSEFQNLSTVATFFSAITASILQFSWNQQGSLCDVVNGFWIMSLVLSVASAMNSQLVYQWRAAMYRSPIYSLPWIVTVWLTRTPFIFLIFSALSFSAGLVVWTYSSHQSRTVSIITTATASLTLFTFPAAFLIWIVFERWAFRSYKGTKWLTDIIWDLSRELRKLVSIQRFKLTNHCIWSQREGRINEATTTQTRRNDVIETQAMTDWMGLMHRTSTIHLGNLESGLAHHSQNKDPNSQQNLELEMIDIADGTSSTGTSAQPVIMGGNRALPESEDTESRKGFDGCALTAVGSVGSNTPNSHWAQNTALCNRPNSITTENLGRYKFRQTARKVIALLRMNRSPASIYNGEQDDSESISSQDSIFTGGTTYFNRRSIHEHGLSHTLRPRSFTILMPALERLKPIQLLEDHVATVKDLQFSPDGKYLVSVSWDNNAIIWSISGNDAACSKQRILSHKKYVHQVAWSPLGTHLLTRTGKTIKIWVPQSGQLLKEISRHDGTQAICWLPSGNAFVFVARGQVHMMNLDGMILDTFTFNGAEIHDVAFTRDSKFMLFVATQPSVMGMEGEEDVIVVFDTVKKCIEDQKPLTMSARSISLSRDGKHVLISYGNNVESLPDIWRIDGVNSRITLDLLFTCVPTHHAHPVFEAPSCFGGDRDQFICGTNKRGEIHIWCRENGLLLHSYKAREINSNRVLGLTTIAWNRADSKRFMLAGADATGNIHIWAAPAVIT
ncbi:hypothetical protein FRC02_009893 [Tulasnella sp. 418]|nr:hypothetical protein FRC02_009893 [Tulasnella sp. 418]